MSKKTKNNRLILYILTAIILVAITCFSSGCTETDVPEDTNVNDTEKGIPATPTPTPTASPENDTSDTTDSINDTITPNPTPTQSPETTPKPTPTSTPTPTPTPPVENTGRPIVSEYPVSESARVDNDYFADAVFVGDSRTQGIQLYGDIKNTTFYAYQGLNVITAMNNNFITENGQNYTVVQALAKHPEFKKIYICLGVNEYWLNTASYKHHYEVLIDAIMAANPNASIYMYAIFPLSKNHSNSGGGLNNEHMTEFNEAALDIAKTRGIYFVNTAEAFLKLDGTLWLDSTESPDGVHLNSSGVKKLTEYLRTHT
ncbi:MAG: hypothetical protein E7593_00990 [Ruminococcaceae bacterium]|nr:hypothetical protein [Oscillospiraceae bacterium]